MEVGAGAREDAVDAAGFGVIEGARELFRLQGFRFSIYLAAPKKALSSSRLGHSPLKADARVRVPLGSPNHLRSHFSFLRD